MENSKGLVTIPTDLDVVPETLELMKRWGADAIRDCDGTEFPEELTKTRSKTQTRKFILHIIRQEKTMSGRRQIRKRYSRCIL